MNYFLKSILLFLLFSWTLSAQDNSKIEEQISYHFNDAKTKSQFDKKAAYKSFEIADSMAAEIKGYEWQLYILSFYISLSDTHYDLSISHDILKRINGILELDSVKNNVNLYNPYKSDYLLNMGNYFYKLKEYEKAKGYFLKLHSQYSIAYDAEASIDNIKDLVRINNFLGSLYKHTGKYELAEQYFQKNISLINQNVHLADQKEAFLTNVNQLLAQLYVQLNQYEKANPIFISGIDTYKRFYHRNKKFKNNLINIYQRTTLNFMKQDSLKKALFYLDESQKYLIENDPFHKESLLLYGDIYAGLGKNQLASENFAKALEVISNYRHQKPHEDIAKVYGKIAEFYLNQGAYQKGIIEIQKALNTAEGSTTFNHFRNNPIPDQVFSKTQLLHLLHVKLQLLDGLYGINKDDALLDIALATSETILTTFDLLQREFESKVDKQFLAEIAYPVFHQMIATVYKAFQNKSSEKTLELAINISEKNKDFMLLEALRGAQASRYATIPNSILDKEQQFRAIITKHEKEIFEKNDPKSTFSETLFTLKQEYYNFLDSIKVSHPKYHNLKYETRTLDLNLIREKVLKSGETLISFTVTSEHLYAIVINDTKEKFIQLPFTNQDKELIRDFYKLISKPSLQQKQDEIRKISSSLFSKILEEPLRKMDSDNLIIIADDILHYLPFDLLRKNGNLLLQTNAISYGNTINTLIELHQKPNSKSEEILAFAPSFNEQKQVNEERKFGKLLYNEDEVAKIGTHFNTSVYSDEFASLENFKTLSTSSSVVHLATHASANDQFPDYSNLAFTQKIDSTESYLLYVKDLYNIQMNTDMVVLSACQTGIGKLRKGQGMMSLSKGFHYAGAKSLVSSLWKVNDRSTVKLMDYFYESLSKGKSKKMALRDAKLKYLENTDDNLLKHPYYWASFTVSGDASPLQVSHAIWWYLLLVLPIILLAFYFLKRKKARALLP